MRLGIAAAALASVIVAQDPYWVANRTSNTLSLVRPWGSVGQTVPTATNLRRVVVAPDGKLWVVRFIQTQFDIYSPAGVLLTTVTNPMTSNAVCHQGRAFRNARRRLPDRTRARRWTVGRRRRRAWTSVATMA